MCVCSSPVMESRHKITSRNNAQVFPDAIFTRNSYIKARMASCLLDCKTDLAQLFGNGGHRNTAAAKRDWTPHATSRLKSPETSGRLRRKIHVISNELETPWALFRPFHFMAKFIGLKFRKFSASKGNAFP